MTANQTLFAHIGMGTVVQKSRVMFITAPGSTTAQRYIEEAKKAKPSKYHNATLGHKFRSILVLDDGTVIMSTIKPMTLMKRLNDVEGADKEIEEEENEEIEIEGEEINDEDH